MIYTFYGYKGGVGRTLALAHVASLLASTRSGSVRVLVIDLDLEAPGSIEILLPPQNGEPPPDRGFSDLLQEYLAGERSLDFLRKRLAEDAYCAGPSLFVLGSGSRERATFLEVNRLLQEAHETKFFERFREACEDYEYVLIDSRTGLADIATAATILLGQALVACFRPNQANMGIAEILRYFLGSNEWDKGDRNARVIPVLSPRPASYSEEAREWARRYQHDLFGESNPIVQIPFEPKFSVGDQLLFKQGTIILDDQGTVTAAAEVDIDAPVISAYLELMNRMAWFNMERDVVAAQREEVRAFAERRYVDAFASLRRIIEREPNTAAHWQGLLDRYEPVVRFDPPLLSKIDAFLRDFLEQARGENGAGRAWAHLLRAWIFGRAAPDGGVSDCERALEIAPSADRELRGLAIWAKARAEQTRDDSRRLENERAEARERPESRSSAILRQLDDAREILGETPNLYIARGDALCELRHYDEAVASYDTAIELAGRLEGTSAVTTAALIAAGRVLDWTGHYGLALRHYRTASEHTHDRKMFHGYVYMLAGLEHWPEAYSTIDRWMTVVEQGRQVEPYDARVIVQLMEGDVFGAARTIDDMYGNKRMWVTRSLRVGLAIRQKNFEAAADIADEDPNDVWPFLRSLGRLSAGRETRSLMRPLPPPKDIPALMLAQLLAGNEEARGMLRRMVRANTGSAKTRALVSLTEALADFAAGVGGPLHHFIESTTSDPDTAIYLRNQLEFRLPWIVAQHAAGAVDRRFVDALQLVCDAWKAIDPPSFDRYPLWPVPQPSQTQRTGIDVMWATAAP